MQSRSASGRPTTAVWIDVARSPGTGALLQRRAHGRFGGGCAGARAPGGRATADRPRNCPDDARADPHRPGASPRRSGAHGEGEGVDRRGDPQQSKLGRRGRLRRERPPSCCRGQARRGGAGAGLRGAVLPRRALDRSPCVAVAAPGSRPLSAGSPERGERGARPCAPRARRARRLRDAAAPRVHCRV